MQKFIVPFGVIGGLLLALWFSTVVAASGQPSGSIYRDQDYQQRQAKERETREWLSGLKNYPPREAYEPACKEDGKREECLLAWRAARAAEIQAKAAVDQLYWSQGAFWFLVFTFAATAAAAYFAYKAAHATHVGAIADQASAAAADKTLKVMQDTSQRELRAYLSVAPGQLGALRKNELPFFLYQITNTGQTPAHSVGHSAEFRIEQYPLPKNFPFPTLIRPTLSRPVLWRDQPVPYRGRLQRAKPFTEAELIEVLDECKPGKGRRLYIFGEVTYVDSFKRPHWTRFCYSLVGNLSLGKMARDGQWDMVRDGHFSELEMAYQHNETDYD
jgi:hypothetical protein